MSTEVIQHAYNDVVAPHYDLDPQQVTGRSLDRAIAQLQEHHYFGDVPSCVLDVGMGTGLFLAKLKAIGGEQIMPFGLDLAANMVASARGKLPDLVAAVDDAAHLDAHFPGQSFDCVATHFITGFVPMSLLAPKIADRLQEGGYWSFVGGTKHGYPALQAAADSRLLRWWFGAGAGPVDAMFCNPADQGEVVRTFEANGFAVCAVETFEPDLQFRDFDEFMEFAYEGGWLTPILESIGMQKLGPVARWLLNRLYFPIHDHHSIVIALARKLGKPAN
jgi:SAM-dependent methyltransferase